jgi:hypothetical protein
VFLRVLLIVISGVALYALLAGVIFPRVLRHQAAKRLTALAGTRAEIQRVSFHPFALRLFVGGVSISDLSGTPLLTLSNMVADLQLASLWRGELFLKRVTVDHPALALKRNSDARVNLLELVQRVRSQRPAAETSVPPSRPFPITIAHFTATNGTIAFRDEFVPGSYEARIAPFDLFLENLTTRTNRTGRLELTASADGGEAFSLAGTVGLQPLAIDAAFKATDISLPRQRPYSDTFSTMAPTSGVVAVEIPFRLSSTPRGIDARVSGGEFSARQLAVIERANGLPVLSAEGVHLDGIEVSLAEHTGSVERFEIGGGVLHVRRAPGGASNLQGMIEPEAIEQFIEEMTHWKVTLKEFQLGDSRVDLVDSTLDPPVSTSLGPVALTLRDFANISNAPPARVELSAQWPGGGSIRADGRATRRPVTADVELVLDALNLEPLQPYLREQVRLTLNRGSLSAQLRAAYGRHGDTPSLARLQGDLMVTNLAATDSASGSDFIRWDTVQLTAIDVGLEPNQFELEELIARGLQTSLIVTSNGQINVLQIIRQTEELTQRRGSRVRPPETDSPVTPGNRRPQAQPDRAEAPSAESPSDRLRDPRAAVPASADTDAAAVPAPTTQQWPVRIGKVRIEDMGIYAADRYYGAGFQTSVESLDGEIRNLSLPPTGPAEVDLKGRLTALSGFALSGQITPDPNAFSTDLRLTTQKADLAQFTPYAIRFAGYPIVRGHLNADVHYKVAGTLLEATNDLVIEQFTLGSRTNSPDAINIPLKLGVALLKDREGRIHLNVPLTGSLADPQFKLGPIIWQAVRNVIVKAATAPFALLGSLFGSEEDLEFVEFDPGQDQPAASQTNRVVTLARALRERPQLSLEILPAFDPEADKEALARSRMDQRLRELRLEEYATQGTATTEVRLRPEDRARLIPVLYRRELGFAPPTSAPLVTAPPTAPAASRTPGDTLAPPESPSPLSVEQMEERLIELTRVTPDDLLALARRRAENIQSVLTTAGGIEPERITLLTEDPDNPGEGKSRVTFRLQ